MLQLVYILAFTILAFLAVGNLIRNLMMLGIESQRSYGSQNGVTPGTSNSPYARHRRLVAHPELLDESGNLVNEPFLVMRSITVEDAREQLDAIYKASPGGTEDHHDVI